VKVKIFREIYWIFHQRRRKRTRKKRTKCSERLISELERENCTGKELVLRTGKSGDIYRLFKKKRKNRKNTLP
jgi:hypothetical protein